MTDIDAEDFKQITQAYEFKEGGHYLLEIKVSSGLTRDDVFQVQRAFQKRGIDAFFVATGGDDFSINAVPAIEKTEE